jgi:hypothetical protein
VVKAVDKTPTIPQAKLSFRLSMFSRRLRLFLLADQRTATAEEHERNITGQAAVRSPAADAAPASV